MTKYNFYQQFYSLLLLFVFIMFCNGQRKTQPAESKETSASYGAGDIVHSVLKDKKGNLWFATSNNGVYRYDGQSFTPFSEKEGLCNKNVSCILEDKTGDLWLCTDGGICRYDGKKITDFDMKESLFSSTVFCIMEDKTGNIWFGTEGGLIRYDGKIFNYFLSSQVIKCLFEDKKGNIWFGRDGLGACKFDGTSFTILLKKKDFAAIM
jgi:ligand-binding sensor domain-containing protein